MEAVAAFGLDNAQRSRMLLIALVQRVCSLVLLALSAARSALLGETGEAMNRWESAWAILRSGFGEARRAAFEGVDAIKAEASLYAAAVGVPGLPLQQYMLDRLMPLSIAAALEEGLRDTLSDVRNDRIQRLTLRHFSVGDETPRLLSARAFDLGAEALAFDVDARWDSNLVAEIDVVTPARVPWLRPRVPVTVSNIKFAGTVRLVLTPLTDAPPGFGAMLLSLAAPPKVELEVRVAGGELTKLPWLRGEIEKIVQMAIREHLLWPRRHVIPAIEQGLEPLLSKPELKALDSEDPMLRAERKVAWRSALRALKEPKAPKDTNEPSEPSEPASDERAQAPQVKVGRLPWDNPAWLKPIQEAYELARQKR